MIPLLIALQFFWPTLAKDREPDVLMAGTWISCPGEGNDYAERAHVFTFKGHALAEFHLGPRQEFALFAGEYEEHIPHNDPRNLLGPAYSYEDLHTVAGGRTWSSAQLGLRINVIAIPPSQVDCYAFSLKVEHTVPILAKQ